MGRVMGKFRRSGTGRLNSGDKFPYLRIDSEVRGWGWGLGTTRQRTFAQGRLVDLVIAAV